MIILQLFGRDMLPVAKPTAAVRGSGTHRLDKKRISRLQTASHGRDAEEQLLRKRWTEDAASRSRLYQNSETRKRRLSVAVKCVRKYNTRVRTL